MGDRAGAPTGHAEVLHRGPHPVGDVGGEARGLDGVVAAVRGWVWVGVCVGDDARDDAGVDVVVVEEVVVVDEEFVVVVGIAVVVVKTVVEVFGCKRMEKPGLVKDAYADSDWAMFDRCTEIRRVMRNS